MLDLRSDFPIFRRKIDEKSIIYLDSASTTLKPSCVIEAEQHYNTRITANIHRGKHALSEEASYAYEDSRSDVARFINASPKSTIFVKNATEALNTIAKGLGLKKTDKVLLPVSEHHSNIVPWMQNASVSFLEGDPTKAINIDDFQRAIETQRPRVVAFSGASNVTGAVNSVKELSRIAREHGIISVIDASQFIAHFPIDVAEIGCDFMAFSGHKMLGPSGIGVLYGTQEALGQLSPLSVGGGNIERVTKEGYTLKDVPYRFEAGTPPISAALGLAAAIKYIQEIGFEKIQAHENSLCNKLSEVFEGLSYKTDVILNQSSNLALASFSLPKVMLGPDYIASSLSENYAIMTRSGHHCTHPFHDAMRLENGSVRISAYIYNTVDDIEEFGQAIHSIASRFSLAA